MKNFSYRVLCFISITITSCIHIFTGSHADLWFYTYSSGEIPGNFSLTPASFLYLNPDKTYTLDFGQFEYGKWTTREDTLILHSVAGRISNYLINYQNSKDLKLSISSGLVSDFTAAPSSFSSQAANPFSLEKNKWRIPASHKETTAEIKQRLINHCQFWKTYFVWALDNNMQYIDVRSTPTPIKVYGNGFALKNFQELPNEWKNYFYDSADCRLASTIIEEIFKKQNIAWANTDNKFKMFIGAFEQLENFLQRNDEFDAMH